MVLVAAHTDLLKAEIAVALDQLKVIVGLAAAALVLAILTGLLLYIGSALFLGEWLFGSIFWGVLDGVLLTVAFIVPIGLNLAGGWVGAWTRAFIVALIIGIILGIAFWLNWAYNAAAQLASQVQPWVAAGVGVGLVLGILLAIVGLRGGIRSALGLLVGGFVLGFLVGAFFGHVRFNHREAAALAFTTGLILWLMLSVWLALRRGFDPKARYDSLVPRESMAQFDATKAYLVEQWQRQRKNLVGR